MCRVVQGSLAPGSEWSGPARIIGFEGDVVWLQHGGIPVASAKHLLHPASTPELLACQVRARAMTPVMVAPTVGPAEQSSYLDARGPQVPSPAGPDVEDRLALSASDDEDDPEPPVRAAVGHDRDPSAVLRPAGSAFDPRPLADDRQVKRPRRGAQTAVPIRGTTAELQEELVTPLDRHFGSVGISSEDPGRKLARSLATRGRTSADSSSRYRSRSRASGH